MNVSNGFKWALGVLATLVLALVIADRMGTIEKIANKRAAREADVKAGTGDALTDFMASLYARLDNALPRLFPSTTEISKALKNYAEATNPARRTELAYDLVALKFRNDIRLKKPLTAEQEKIYKNAVDQMAWAANLVGYYMSKVPDSQLQGLSVQIDGQTLRMKPAVTKKMLAMNLSPARDACTADDVTHLTSAFTDQYVAIHATELMRVFMILQGQVYDQELAAMEKLVIESATKDSDREVIVSFYKIRNSGGEGAHKLSERDSKLLHAFLADKGRELAFEIYGTAPGCFKPANVAVFLGLLRKVQSEVRARFYLDLLRASYRKTHVVPEDLAGLGIERPGTLSQEFYHSPVDGWYTRLELRVDGKHVELISAGPDRVVGTADDFVAAEGGLEDGV